MFSIPPNETELQTTYRDVERSIQEQLDRIYDLVEKKRNVTFLKIEYKRAVELITQKYVLLNQALEKTKASMDEQEYQTQTQALKDQYKEDLILLAVSIDEATTPSSAQS
ncbi:MAG TPA: hypothetical protein VJB99_04010 [Patescibacteria group bacterium]|nr:hypothetical protein [Patescibacteria group bacterium]